MRKKAPAVIGSSATRQNKMSKSATAFPPNLRVYDSIMARLRKQATKRGMSETRLASSLLDRVLGSIESGALTIIDGPTPLETVNLPSK